MGILFLEISYINLFSLLGRLEFDYVCFSYIYSTFRMTVFN